MAARSVSSMASITRNAVGTEATAPKTSACRRRPNRFARASPPPAMVTARSEITLPGSCRRRRLHIGASASDRASVSPERSAISASRRLPAWVASPLPSAVTFNAGRHLVAFTWYVPSCLGFWRLDNPIFPGQEGFFADLPSLHSTANEECGLTSDSNPSALDHGVGDEERHQEPDEGERGHRGTHHGQRGRRSTGPEAGQDAGVSEPSRIDEVDGADRDEEDGRPATQRPARPCAEPDGVAGAKGKLDAGPGRRDPQEDQQMAVDV